MLTEVRTRTHKFCPRCMEMVPLTQFGTNIASDSGYQPYCRDCFNAYKRERDRRIRLGLPTATQRIPQRWDIDERIAAIEARTADDLTRGGSAFSS
jgi:hypothetical protein